MKIVKLDSVKPGDVLGKSLYNQSYELVVSAGFKLTDEMINTLRRRKYTYIYIMDELTKDIIPEEVVSETVRVMVNRKLAETLQEARKNLAFETFAPEEVKKRLVETSKLPNIRMISVRKAVADLVDEILETGREVFASLPIDEGQASDLQHSLDVTILSILIGQRFGFSPDEMRQLGTAAMLHDIGKLAFPSIIKKDYSQQSRDERMILREHPTYSMLILKGAEPEAFIEHVTVQQHHEYFDGTGYPNRIKGASFPPTRVFKRDKTVAHRFSEILSAANLYDNLLRGQYDGTRRTPEEAITVMAVNLKRKVNPHILKVLPELIQTYPTGALVRLLTCSSGTYDGFYGIVARSNKKKPNRPLLLLTHDASNARCKPLQLDLAGEQEVTLDLVL